MKVVDRKTGLVVGKWLLENMNKNGWLGELVGRGIQWLVEMVVNAN